MCGSRWWVMNGSCSDYGLKVERLVISYTFVNIDLRIYCITCCHDVCPLKRLVKRPTLIYMKPVQMPKQSSSPQVRGSYTRLAKRKLNTKQGTCM